MLLYSIVTILFNNPLHMFVLERKKKYKMYYKLKIKAKKKKDINLNQCI